MEPVGEGIREELRRLGADSSAAPDQNDAWLAAVGPEIARNAWPARTQADGTLIVHVRDAIWGFELSQQARRDRGASAGPPAAAVRSRTAARARRPKSHLPRRAATDSRAGARGRRDGRVDR